MFNIYIYIYGGFFSQIQTSSLVFFCSWVVLCPRVNLQFYHNSYCIKVIPSWESKQPKLHLFSCLIISLFLSKYLFVSIKHKLLKFDNLLDQIGPVKGFDPIFMCEDESESRKEARLATRPWPFSNETKHIIGRCKELTPHFTTMTRCQFGFGVCVFWSAFSLFFF